MQNSHYAAASNEDRPKELRKLLTDFYAPKKLVGVTTSTRRKYDYAIDHLQAYLKHEPTIFDLDDDLISTWLHWMTEQGLAAATANSYGSKIVAMWDLLGRKNIAADRPCVKRLRVPKRKPIGWNDEELRRLFKACSEFPGTYCGIPARLWWVAIHSVILQTGERIGAILQMTWKDYNPTTRLLLRPAEIRKWQTEDMATILEPDVAYALELIRNPIRERIFPWSKSNSTLNNHYDKLLAMAGLPGGRKRKFHCTRKSSGSRVKRLGGDPQKHLGHQNPSTTEAYMVPELIGEEFDTSQIVRPFAIREFLDLAG